MGKVEGIFVGVYVVAYALSKCPWFGGSIVTYGLIAMAIMVVIMLAQRFRYIHIGFKPRVAYEKAAIFVAGADQPTGWQTVLRCETRDMRVFAGVEDLDAPTTDWMRRHLPRNTTIVKLDPTRPEDAEAAARFVAESLEDKVLVGVVYAGYSVPKMSDVIDLDEVKKGIEINAMGAVYIARAFSSLLKNNKGRFIFTADLAGRIALPTLLPYCMSETVALQYANIIRAMLEKDRVSVHVIEQILFNFRKTQESFFYPSSSPQSGKVILKNRASRVDERLYLLVNTIIEACLDKNPKERYLPSYEDIIMDKIIRFSPDKVRNYVVSYYLKNYLMNKYML